MTGMADPDLLMYPEHRRRAEETIAMARNVQEAQARERLLKVARSYQRLAVRAKAARKRERINLEQVGLLPVCLRWPIAPALPME